MRSRILAWALTGVVMTTALVGGLGGQGLPAHAAERCTGYANNPHYSTGAGGVIFKMRSYCRVNTTIDVVSGRLWLCPKPPTGSETYWSDQGCLLKAYRNLFDQYVAANTTRTWYVPRKGLEGKHGTGYWVSVAFFSDGGDTVTVRSKAVWIKG